ncbi:hypothetical protein [Parabacteroides sp. PF5-6]|nr:hypothetical protein [Parabacteroides sp. PF5-6]MDF9830283.1 hypothetical protein [Parabacteroides sp. PF5-6]
MQLNINYLQLQGAGKVVQKEKPNIPSNNKKKRTPTEALFPEIFFSV